MRLPAAVAAKAQQFADSGAAPAAPRDSATVMLLRPAAATGDVATGDVGMGEAGRAGFQAEGAGRSGTGGSEAGGASEQGAGLEVYMLRRRQSMAFAAGAYVFPGGSVDSRDSDGELTWAGPSVEEWAAALGCPPGLARGLVCAAVRETFEEAGVLLAGAGPVDLAAPSATVPSATVSSAAVPFAAVPSAAVPPAAELEPDRLALLDRSLSLAEMLARRNLVLRTDLLKPWARWVTPDPEPRRFDTRFFAALLPAGQQTADIQEEADQVAWLRPADVLAAAARGEVYLMPPTAVTLAELAACPDTAAVFAAERRITPRQPVITLADGHAWLCLPEGLELPYER